MSYYSTFKPGQSVIVCLDDPESGATLGYYGTIIRIFGKSKTQFPNQPQHWYYRVEVPYLNKKIDVPARMLLSTENLGRSEFKDERDQKICFDKRPDQDNDEISGSYRLSSGSITYFMFRKSDMPVATYKLDMQIHANHPETLLLYHVPKNATLNSEYVRLAIRELLGIRSSSDDEESASSGPGA